MKGKIWPLLILIGLVAIAGGVLFLEKVTVLHLENMDRPKSIHMRISSSETFSMFYIHSIYRQPVIEEFQVGKGAIVLKGVRTKSPAVMEYYGYEDTKEFHPMDQKLGAIYFKWGTGEGQGLIIRGRKIYLSEIGERGDRIQLRVDSTPLGKYLLSTVWKYH